MVSEVRAMVVSLINQGLVRVRGTLLLHSLTDNGFRASRTWNTVIDSYRNPLSVNDWYLIVAVRNELWITEDLAPGNQTQTAC